MKKFLIFVLAVSLLGGAVGGYFWMNRYDLAIEHLQSNPSRGPKTHLAMNTLLDFVDRPELEQLVREDYLAVAKQATQPREGTKPRPRRAFSNLAGDVYQAQPDRIDEEIITAVMTVECAGKCGIGPLGRPKRLDAPYWLESFQEKPEFIAALRTAALQLSKLRSDRERHNSEESYEVLTRTLAKHATQPDPELAQAIATRVIHLEPMEKPATQFAKSIAKIAGEESLPKVWSAAFAAEPETKFQLGWSPVVDSLLAAEPPSASSEIEDLAAFCARRSTKFADAGCVDLSLAWGSVWKEALGKVGVGELSAGAKHLSAGHDKAASMSWQSVVEGYKNAKHTPYGAPPGGTGRTSVMHLAKGVRVSRQGARRVAALAKAGKAPVPNVLDVYRSTKSSSILRETGEIVAKHAPEAIAKDVQSTIPAFRTVANAFARKMPSLDFDKYYTLGYRIGLGLELLRAHSPENAVTPLLLALSIPDPAFSEYASSALRRSVKAEQFADGLFRFLASRSSFSMEEVKLYESTLTSYRDVGPHIVANMERMLTAAKGRPERVPWIQKYIGLKALGKVGGADSEDVLALYAKDKSTFEKRSTEKLTGKSSSTTLSFAELARDSLTSVQKRSNRTVQ